MRSASPPPRRRQAHRPRAYRYAPRCRDVSGSRQARHPSLPRLRHGRSGRSPATVWSPATGASTAASVFAFAQDFTVFGGSLSETNAAKIVKIMDLALKMGAPVVGLNDSGGARIQEGVCRSAATPTSFCATRWPPGWSRRSQRSWGRAPAARSTRRQSPTSTSWSRARATCLSPGPDVIRTVTHEEVTKEELGGAMTHNATSGVAHFACRTTRMPASGARAARISAVATTSTTRRGRETADPVDREDEALDRLVPDRRISRTTCST